MSACDNINFNPTPYQKENIKNDASGKEAEKEPIDILLTFRKHYRPPCKKIPYVPLSSFHPIPFPSAECFFYSQLPEKILDAIGRLECLEEQATVKQELLKTRSIELPLPTIFPSNDLIVILWRGCGAEQLIKVILHKSFSLVSNPEALPPSEEEAKMQVAEQANFPEFTNNPEIGERFGTNQYVAAFAIDSRYLARGSRSEDGFICRYEAPLQLVKWKEGRKLFSETEGSKRASQRRRAFREEQAKKAQESTFSCMKSDS